MGRISRHIFQGLLHSREVYCNTKKHVSDRQLNDEDTPKVYLCKKTLGFWKRINSEHTRTWYERKIVQLYVHRESSCDRHTSVCSEATQFVVSEHVSKAVEIF